MSGDGSGSHHDGGRVPDGVPDFTGPAAPEPDFLPCYRHPDRSTGITCQRCRRPICMACMQEAAVGFHCPDCAGVTSSGSGRGDRRGGRGGGGPVGGGGPFGRRDQPERPWTRGASGGGTAARSGGSLLERLQVSHTPVTWGLVAACVLVALVGLFSGGRVTSLLALSGAGIEAN